MHSTRKVVPTLYTWSACIRSFSGRTLNGAARSKTSTIVCRARDGHTTVDTALHAGQLFPPFCSIACQQVACNGRTWRQPNEQAHAAHICEYHKRHSILMRRAHASATHPNPHNNTAGTKSKRFSISCSCEECITFHRRSADKALPPPGDRRARNSTRTAALAQAR